jgi:hypothetical protein
MNLDTAARQPAAGSGGRFYLVGYLPAYAASLFLLLLVWAGAPAWRGRPGHRIRFTTAWATASHLSLELPRVFRTGKLRLIHAASCPFRYSSRTSCGVRYPSVEWRRVLL